MKRAHEVAAIDAYIAKNGVKRIEDKPEPLPPGHVEIWTDGSCLNVSRRGGWGAILICNGKERELFGGAHDTTNNRMELMAAIAALEALKRPCSVRLYSDSRYVIYGIKSWIKAWKRRGWTTKAGQPVINVDLWMRLDLAAHPHRIDWRWVRGHNGTPLNERADQLAATGAANGERR